MLNFFEKPVTNIEAPRTIWVFTKLAQEASCSIVSNGTGLNYFTAYVMLTVTVTAS